MKAFLRYFGILFLFWLAFFLLQRNVFLLFQFEKVRVLPFSEVLASNWHGFAMDISTASYVLLFPALFAIPLLFVELRILRKLIWGFLLFTIILNALVTVSDIGLFQAWGTLINRKALSYLAYPEEAGAAMAGGPVFLLLLGMVLLIAIAWSGLRKIDHQRTFNAGPVGGRIAAALILPLLLFIGLRGGPQDLPIDKSWSYYSRHPVLNLAAVNGLWNLVELGVNPAEYETNPYGYMPPAEAESIVQYLHAASGDSTTRILNSNRPNIVMILLESWTADIIDPLGGDSGVAPAFTRLSQQGLLFTNFYSTGFRTEQGLCALVSGFPSQPRTTIIRKFGKFDQLPSLVQVLDSNGYDSRYYYTGDITFANTRAYLDAMGFDRIYSEEDVTARRATRWGAYDEELFEFYEHDRGTSDEPFFHLLMTSTSHEPFDAPVRPVFPGKDMADGYRNTVHYTDSCVGAFMDKALKAPWADNTLFIIVADHGHFLPHYTDHYAPERHRIPFLLLGGALRKDLHGAMIDTYACHVDFPATLLAQMGLPSHRFPWSKDLFDPHAEHFAFYSFDDGFGYADSQQTVVYDHQLGQPLSLRDSLIDPSRQLSRGQAYLQVLLDRYIGLSQ